MPGFLYWKNEDSIYLGGNENFIKVAKLKTLSELIGKSDFIMVPVIRTV